MPGKRNPKFVPIGAGDKQARAPPAPAPEASGLLLCSVFAVCASVSFGLYFVTLFPSVPGGDSGEMITVAYQVQLPPPRHLTISCSSVCLTRPGTRSSLYLASSSPCCHTEAWRGE